MTFVLESQSAAREFRSFVTEEVHEELSSEFVMSQVDKKLAKLRNSTNLKQDFENFAKDVQKLLDEVAERARLLVKEMDIAKVSAFTIEEALHHQDELMPLLAEALQQLIRSTPDVEIRQTMWRALDVLCSTRVPSPSTTTSLRLAIELQNRVPLK